MCTQNTQQLHAIIALHIRYAQNMIIVSFPNEMPTNSVQRIKGVALLLGLLIAIIQVEAEEERKITLRKFEKIKEDAEDFESAVKLGERDAEGRITVSGSLKQKVTLNNDWKVNITVFRADEPDKALALYKQLPPLGVCQLMSTYYKNYFYDTLKNYSNAPDPDTCPLPPENYQMTDYPIDASSLKKRLQPGYYRIVGELLNDGNAKLAYLSELLVE